MRFHRLALKALQQAACEVGRQGGPTIDHLQNSLRETAEPRVLDEIAGCAKLEGMEGMDGQTARLLASKGITTMEAFRELGITCVHKRIAELEELFWQEWMPAESPAPMQRIIRTKERTATGSIVTRYKLAR